MRKKRPVRAMILTSIRDVGACDLNGCEVPTKQGFKYMEGIIEYATRECAPRGQLDHLLEIVGIVTDDLPKNLEDSDYPLVPTAGKQWIHPLDLLDRHGRSVCGLTVYIPSEFRRISEAEGKREAKRDFEKRVFEHMREIGADIIISDHHMTKIQFLIGEFGLAGKILNIHPAITDKRHECCFRGCSPTVDAIARARSGKQTVTGATLHIMNEEFDAGEIILCEWPTPVHPDDSPVELRWRNYQLAKLPVFTQGMKSYIEKVF